MNKRFFREVGLLWDPADSTNRYRQYIATIISHEFAHMWFGDLVTTHWWSDTFLNEGFATYYEWLGSAQVIQLPLSSNSTNHFCPG